MVSASRFPALFVLGVAHCGSTLLGRMLDCHPRLRCFGELMRLDRAVELGLLCSCGAALDACAEWQAFLPRLEPQHGYDSRRFTLDHYRELARLADVDVAVDLSKTLAWRQARAWRRQGAGFLLLVRDSRGVLAASERAGRSVDRRIARHVKWMKRLTRFAEKCGDSALVVHYEDLCRDPRAVLERITTFLGLPFDEAMLRPVDQRHHFVHTSASPYLVGSNDLRLDERWREELAPDLRQAIERGMTKVPLLATRYLR